MRKKTGVGCYISPFAIGFLFAGKKDKATRNLDSSFMKLLKKSLLEPLIPVTFVCQLIAIPP